MEENAVLFNKNNRIMTFKQTKNVKWFMFARNTWIVPISWNPMFIFVNPFFLFTFNLRLSNHNFSFVYETVKWKKHNENIQNRNEHKLRDFIR